MDEDNHKESFRRMKEAEAKFKASEGTCRESTIPHAGMVMSTVDTIMSSPLPPVSRYTAAALALAMGTVEHLGVMAKDMACKAKGEFIPFADVPIGQPVAPSSAPGEPDRSTSVTRK